MWRVVNTRSEQRHLEAALAVHLVENAESDARAQNVWVVHHHAQHSTLYIMPTCVEVSPINTRTMCAAGQRLVADLSLHGTPLI